MACGIAVYIPGLVPSGGKGFEEVYLELRKLIEVVWAHGDTVDACLYDYT